MLTTVCYTLNNSFGFGAKRIKDFKRAFDSHVQYTLDLDYMGEHYVKLEDYAIEIKEKFGFDIDIDKVAAATAIFDEKDIRYHMMKAEIVIKELKAAGFEDAAKFLEAKLD